LEDFVGGFAFAFEEGEEVGVGAEAVLEGIEAGFGFAFCCSGAGGFLGVGAVGG
jgi:hypothetical protein